MHPKILHIGLACNDKRNISPRTHTHLPLYHFCPGTWHMCSGKRLILPVWRLAGSFCRLIISNHIKPDQPANQILMGHQTPNPPLKIPHAVENSGSVEVIYK